MIAIAISLFACCVVVCVAGLKIVQLGIGSRRVDTAHESTIELEERVKRLELWKTENETKKMFRVG